MESPDDNAERPESVQALEVTVVVPTETLPLKTVIVVPFASVLVPLAEVAPGQIGKVTTGAAELLCTFTNADAALTHFPVASAVAVIESPATSADKPDFVHALVVTVVVPRETFPLNTVMVVPFTSLLVPLTDVAPGQIGEVTAGTAELVCTFTNVDAELAHFPVA